MIATDARSLSRNTSRSLIENLFVTLLTPFVLGALGR
jgi:hypothetical protein